MRSRPARWWRGLGGDDRGEELGRRWLPLWLALGIGAVVGERSAALLGALLGDVLAVAGAVDVEADGVHGGAVEDGDGERGIAEVAAPGGELDVGGEGGRGVSVALVDQVEEGVGRGRLVLALLFPTAPYVAGDQQIDGGP